MNSTVPAPAVGYFVPSDVTFMRNVISCGYLATVGDPGNNLVNNPDRVYRARLLVRGFTELNRPSR